MELKFKLLYKQFSLLLLIVQITKKLRVKKLSKSDREILAEYLKRYKKIYSYWEQVFNSL